MGISLNDYARSAKRAPAASSPAGTRAPENNARIVDTDETRLVIVAKLLAVDGRNQPGQGRRQRRLLVAPE